MKSRPPLVVFVVLETLKMVFCNLSLLTKCFDPGLVFPNLLWSILTFVPGVLLEIFLKTNFLSILTYFKFSIGINSGNMLNKVTVCFVFIEFKSAIHLASAFNIFWSWLDYLIFFSCIEELLPLVHFFFGRDTSRGSFEKGFLLLGSLAFFEHFRSLLLWLFCFNYVWTKLFS